MSEAEPIRFGPSPSPAEAQEPTPAPAWAYLLRCPDGSLQRRLDERSGPPLKSPPQRQGRGQVHKKPWQGRRAPGL